ncbi:MAG: tetratricopeptide repeat protein [Melioribacteraceae bacterium]|nr:tetratricopeptide repeat protein [Melioribacteraceae bacterium]
MNNVAEVRLTLYAFISAIESDLRSLIRTNIIPFFQDSTYIKDENLLNNCKKTFSKDNPGLEPNKNYEMLVDYIYFQDAYKILFSNKEIIPENIFKTIKRLEPQLNSIIPIRNRVMHHRPLLSGDFSSVYTFAFDLIPQRNVEWTSTKSVLEKLENDPSIILTYNIPDVEKISNKVYHNLPMPDFDESGFIGRENDCESISKLILGTNRVVSIIGDGGVGKSALILKVAYDIIDLNENCPFDAIIWTSAKTTMLSANGILAIKDSINNFNSFVGDISSQFGTPSEDLKSNILDILEFMDQFNVLLIIDNLETIHDDEIKNFIREAQQKAKIAITSRLGLGELEYPRILEGFTERESAQLVREIARVRNSKILKQLSNKQLSEISSQLHYNPLALKWFINSVDIGKSPKEILNNKSDLLKFCLSNVYDKLTLNSKLVISTMLAARKPLNDAELNFITNLEPLELRKALNQLLTTTLIQRDFSSKIDISEPIYNVSDFAREFLVSEYPLDKDFIKGISEKRKQLLGGFEEAKRATTANEFNLYAFTIRTKNERVIARYLQEAMQLSKPETRDYIGALERIKSAKDIVPNYFEIYRVSAFIKAVKGDLLGAENDYKTALELEPSNARLLYFYAGFLLHQMEDTNDALKYAKKALDQNPNASDLKILYARCVGYLGDFEGAINILETMRGCTSDITAKDRKVSSTLIIDFYRRWAEDDISIKKDYNEAIAKLEKSFIIFDNSVSCSEIDFKILNCFANSFTYYLRCNRKNPIITKQDVHNKFKKYSSYLIQSDRFSLIKEQLLKYFEFDASKMSSVSSDRIVGMITNILLSKNYGFIENFNKETFFFHRGDLTNENDWEVMHTGLFIEFAPSENERGKVAHSIRLLPE